MICGAAHRRARGDSARSLRLGERKAAPGCAVARCPAPFVAFCRDSPILRRTLSKIAPKGSSRPVRASLHIYSPASIRRQDIAATGVTDVENLVTDSENFITNLENH